MRSLAPLPRHHIIQSKCLMTSIPFSAIYVLVCASPGLVSLLATLCREEEDQGRRGA